MGRLPVIKKRVLVKQRVRRPPESGFSWIDRKFVHAFAPKLSQEAILLYFFLAAVSDKNGLSYYRDDSLATRLRLRLERFIDARDELIRHDLIACELPLTQVLSLPSGPHRRQQAGGLHAMHELFDAIADDERDSSKHDSSNVK